MIRAKRRDRHGRGLRGPLAPPEVPISLTRSERFDELVREEVQRLVGRWATELAGVDFAVEDVPKVTGASRVPLSEVRQTGGSPRIVVFRRPIEARGSDGAKKDERDLGKVIHEALVDEVAGLLGVPPDQIDPEED